MDTNNNQCSVLKATLGPNDLAGTSYALTVTGTILAGPEKPVYSLLENGSPDLNRTILTLQISPTPTKGDQSFKITDFIKLYDEKPPITTIKINDDSGTECDIEVEEFITFSADAGRS